MRKTKERRSGWGSQEKEGKDSNRKERKMHTCRAGSATMKGKILKNLQVRLASQKTTGGGKDGGIKKGKQKRRGNGSLEPKDLPDVNKKLQEVVKSISIST